VAIEASLPQRTINLDETIDYASVYSLIKEEFSHTEQLLENLSLRIIQKIFMTFNQAENISLTIIKKNAPIIGFKGQVGVKNTLNRSAII
jgi:dihydroneopterin aldolase